MIKDSMLIIVSLVVGGLFVYFRNRIFKEVKENLPIEKFDIKKFKKGMLSFHASEWAKDIYSLFNLRKLTIYFIILSSVYGYGWYKGQLGKPALFNLEGKEAYIKINNHYLHIKKDGSAEVVDSDKKTVLKVIRVKDIPELRKALKPYGFQFKPIGVLGLGMGNNNRDWEGGVGISFLKYWRWRIETFLTNKGIYLGTSYKLDRLGLNNSYLGVGAGKGYKGDNRVLFYYKWEF